MRALIRKEIAEILAIVALAYVAVSWMWIVALPEEALLWPLPGLRKGVAFVAAGWGLTFGCGTFAFERLRGTEGYLAHRSGGHRDAFRAKCAAGLGATVVLGMLPAVAFCAWTAATTSLGPILQPWRVLELAAYGSVGLPVFAVAAFAVQLKRSSWIDGGLALVAALGVFAFSLSVALLLPGPWPIAHVVVNLALTAGILALAERLFRARLDRDLALPSRLFAAVAVVGVPLFVMPLLMLSSHGRSFVAKALCASYPAVGYEAGTDRWSLVEPGDSGPHADAMPDVIGYRPGEALRRVESWRAGSVDLRRPGPLDEWLPLDAVSSLGLAMARPFEAQGIGFVTAARFDVRAGVVHVFAYEREGGYALPWPAGSPAPTIPSHEVLRKPGSERPFSPRTRVLGSAHKDLPACLADPDDGSLWTYAPGRSPALVRIELPGADRFVAFEYGLDPRLARFDVAQAMGPWNFVRGERGVYCWLDGTFVPHAKDGRVALAGDVPEAGGVRLAVEGAATFAPRVEVVDTTTGEVRFAHAYGPRGLRDWKLVAAVHFTSLQGAPLASLRAFLSPSAGPLDLDAVAPGSEFTNGAHPWLLATHVALGAWLAWLLAGRMRKRGAERWTIRLGVVLVATCGPFAYLLLRVLGGRAASGIPRSHRVRGREVRMAASSEVA